MRIVGKPAIKRYPTTSILEELPGKILGGEKREQVIATTMSCQDRNLDG